MSQKVGAIRWSSFKLFKLALVQREKHCTRNDATSLQVDPSHIHDRPIFGCGVALAWPERVQNAFAKT